jgi:hypothetical protein
VESDPHKGSGGRRVTQFAVSPNEFSRLVFALTAPQYAHLVVSRNVPINMPIYINNIVSAKSELRHCAMQNIG